MDIGTTTTHFVVTHVAIIFGMLNPTLLME